MNNERDPLLSTNTTTSTTSTTSSNSYPLQGDGKLYTKSIINSLLLIAIVLLAFNEITPFFKPQHNSKGGAWALPSDSIKEIHMQLDGALWEVTVHRGFYSNSLFTFEVESPDWTIQTSTNVYANVDPIQNDRVLVFAELVWWLRWWRQIGKSLFKTNHLVKIRLIVNLSRDLEAVKVFGEDVRFLWQSVNVAKEFLVETSRGSVALVTPLVTEQLGIKIHESGLIVVANLSAAQSVALATGEGDVRCYVISGYRQLTALTGDGDISLRLTPGLENAHHQVNIERTGVLAAEVYGFKGRFSVDAPYGQARFDGIDWPLERNNPDVGTVGGKGVGNGTFLVRIGGKGWAELSFKPPHP
ncbi:hypothetical protein BDR26DRAFT_710501 [Obelidium mucronatum]|nr:hypothetical protein BDR26DRAFT_710501 [Obelidium mucronatum]